MVIELFVFSFATNPVFSSLISSPGPFPQPEMVSFETQLRATIREVQDSGAALYIVDYLTPGADRRVQDEIRRIAEETGAGFIPLFDTIGDSITDFLHDSIHPNPEGHRMISEEIVPVALRHR